MKLLDIQFPMFSIVVIDKVLVRKCFKSQKIPTKSPDKQNKVMSDSKSVSELKLKSVY